MSRPRRHQESARNRRKALHFAKNLLGELEYIDRKLRRIRNEHVGHALDRVYKLVNRLRSEREQHR
jgi:hypothetical protein